MSDEDTDLKFTLIYKLCNDRNYKREQVNSLRIVRIKGVRIPSLGRPSDWASSNFTDCKMRALDEMIAQDAQLFEEDPSQFPKGWAPVITSYELITHMRGWPSFIPIHVTEQVTATEKSLA